jgi:hypothetical protein
MLIASSRKHIMWYKEEIEKLMLDVPENKVRELALPQFGGGDDYSVAC